jgi:hypothetical protein
MGPETTEVKITDDKGVTTTLTAGALFGHTQACSYISALADAAGANRQ